MTATGFFKKLFSLTATDSKFPTDRNLDGKMQLAALHLHELERLTKEIFKKKIILFIKYKWFWLVKKTIYTSLILGVLFFIYKAKIRPSFVRFIINEKVSDIEKSIKDHPIAQGNIDFWVGIRQLEGSNDYKAIRSWTESIKGRKVKVYSQYWGAYQMGDLCREEIGLKDMPMEKFLNDKIIQDWAMNKYMNVNYKFLYPYIAKYNIPTYGGVRIGNNLVTVSGLIAAAHLVGHTAVIAFLETDGKVVACDGNKIPLTKYLQLNNLKLNFE